MAASTDDNRSAFRTPRIALTLLVGAGLALAMAVVFAWGYRTGSRRAFIRDRHQAMEPDIVNVQPAAWSPEPKELEIAQDGRKEPPAPVPDATEHAQNGFVLDMAQPIRLTWPLDIGPDIAPGSPDARLCLRARKGAGQIQTPGSAVALYPFRIHKPGLYQSHFRVRWVWDGVDSVECNNSWFAGFNDDPLAVIGDTGTRTDWHWTQGPERFLDAGVHWLRVEMREDGPMMDRTWVAPADAAFAAETLDAMTPVVPRGFSGVAPPTTPHVPLNDAEFFAVPTASLVIGKTHVNEVTVAAAWQGDDGLGFEGEIEILFPTASGVALTGEHRVQCDADRPFTTQTIRLHFPPKTPRRVHVAHIRVRDAQGQIRFLEHIRFIKPLAWAFLGPFADSTHMVGEIHSLFKHPADLHPQRLAFRQSHRELNMSEQPLARNHTSRQWKIIDDGSCFDWSGAVDLNKVYGHVSYAYAYAVTWIHAQRLLHHRPFSLQLDDQGWLWMNNRFLVARALNLPLDANRLWTSARLDMGKNPVVIKVTQKGKFWGFRLDVVDWHYEGRRGDVITGVDPRHWPVAP